MSRTKQQKGSSREQSGWRRNVGERYGDDNGLQRPHTPVLLSEVIEGLRVTNGGCYVDGTVGAGGHSEAILRSAKGVRLLGLDVDPAALLLATELLQPYVDSGQATLIRSNFDQMSEAATRIGYKSVDGILLDLGVSSMQLDRPERGFSFREDGPLDMRLDPDGPEPAFSLVNSLAERELADLIYRYGEETASRRIARKIVEARQRRPIQTTIELAAIVASATGGRVAGRSRNPMHPATRTFQALRIAVNRELEALESGLAEAIDLLRPGGRLAVISFHSLEDRIVKHFIRQEQRGCVCPPELPQCVCGISPRLRAVNTKPVEATDEEKRSNPRSRSAKLRVAEKLPAEI